MWLGIGAAQRRQRLTVLVVVTVDAWCGRVCCFIWGDPRFIRGGGRCRCSAACRRLHVDAAQALLREALVGGQLFDAQNDRVGRCLPALVTGAVRLRWRRLLLLQSYAGGSCVRLRRR